MQSLDSGDVVSTNFLVLNLIEKKLNSEAMNKSLSGKKKKKASRSSSPGIHTA